ncbi:outer membrane protein [Labrys miyagiensis]|nr:outer membrane protein [Labrys miyagiensis]
MKRFVLAMLLLSPVPAFAADLSPEPAEPAPAVVTPYNWTGFYVGAHIGYGWGREHDTLRNTTLAEAMDRFDVNGVLGGIHGGYNQQFDGNFVVGLEADADLSGIQGNDHTAQAGGASRLDMRNRWQSSIRARVGYAFDRFLVYATGGMAIGDIRERWTILNGTLAGSSTKTRVGWTAGAGVEYAFDDHWVGRAEVRYTDFGKSNFTVGSGVRFKAGFHETVGLIGVSYKF